MKLVPIITVNVSIPLGQYQRAAASVVLFAKENVSYSFQQLPRTALVLLGRKPEKLVSSKL